MGRFILLSIILVFLGVYFFWTEILLQERILKKKKIYKVSGFDISQQKNPL